MALPLVDRARIKEKVGTGTKVEGRTIHADTTGAWFRARLTLPAGQKQQDESGQRRKERKQPTLLYGKRDTEGEPVELEADQKVEVESEQLGSAVWRVVGTPEPLRRRRSLLGWLATLERVSEVRREEV
jgi:hypothetical protein